MGDHVAFGGALVVEVELLEGLARWESRGADAEFAAVGLPCRDFAIETRR